MAKKTTGTVKCFCGARLSAIRKLKDRARAGKGAAMASLLPIPHISARRYSSHVHVDNGKGVPLCGYESTGVHYWQPTDDEPTCAKCIRMNKPRPMTLAQAREKARERWGENGRVWKERGWRIVGYKKITSGPRLVEAGEGSTFEQAFADADKREAEAKARHDMEIKIGDTVQAWGSVGEVTDVHSGDAATPPCRKIYSVWFGEATFYVRDDEVQAVNRIPVIKEKPNA